MSDIYRVDADLAAKSHCDGAAYARLYKESIDNPDAFWAKQAERLDWSLVEAARE